MSDDAPQLSILEVGPEPLPEQAQWFTPPVIAAELVGLARSLIRDADLRRLPVRVLEPSAGSGNLVAAIQARLPGATVDAVEIDARFTEHLEALSCTVDCVDYLERAAPSRRYDLIVANPPYDGGAETEHLAKMLDEGERILVLLPTRSLHGRRRYERVWFRFDPKRPDRDWWLRQTIRCVTRPKFSALGGSDEIVLLDLRRAPGPCDARWF